MGAHTVLRLLILPVFLCSASVHLLSVADDDEPSDAEIYSAIEKSLARLEEKKRHKSHVHRRDEKYACYTGFGCFRHDGPFSYLKTLPSSPEIIGTSFQLFTRKNPIEGDVLRYENSSTLYYSHFNGSNPVKIIVHGFGSNGKKSWVKQMTEALLYMEDLNVIVVDWEKGATMPNYVQAVANTQLIGKQTAAIVHMINYERGLTPQDYHIIGFSLGAHVAGFAGKECKNISRITGLDPAAPLFEGHDSHVRLDSSDATFVDIIHSNGNSVLKGGLGAYTALGHADFYPNGGRFQIGCNNLLKDVLSDIFYGNWRSLCHHRRALHFFIDSIFPTCTFTAFSCDTYENFLQGKCFSCAGNKCSNMGYYADRSRARGNLYLVTRKDEPYCASQFRISVTPTGGQGKTWGKLEFTFVTDDGSNETFVLTSESQEISDKQDIQGIMVAHPSVKNITQVVLRYSKYRGWIYSGLEKWQLSKIYVVDGQGHSFSYCGYATSIQNGDQLTLPMSPGDCRVEVPTQRLARLIWQVVGEPVTGRDPRPPMLLWKILVDDKEMYTWQKQ